MLLYGIAKPGLRCPSSQWALNHSTGKKTWGHPSDPRASSFGSRPQNLPHLGGNPKLAPKGRPKGSPLLPQWWQEAWTCSCNASQGQAGILGYSGAIWQCPSQVLMPAAVLPLGSSTRAGGGDPISVRPPGTMHCAPQCSHCVDTSVSSIRHGGDVPGWGLSSQQRWKSPIKAKT